jgi:hypothetical protein
VVEKTPVRVRTSDADLDAAVARSKRAKRGTKIVAVVFDSAGDRIVAELSTGATIWVPRRAIPAFGAVKPKDLTDLAVDAAGYSIWSSTADVGLQIEGLIEAASGVAVRDLAARTLGRSKSSAKAAASRANGAKGGRPRGTRVPAVKKAS